MSKSLIKANHIVVKTDEKRVIDSNQMISDRIRVLTEILENQPSEEFFEEFSEGLNAEQVEQLLSDPEAEPYVDEGPSQEDIERARQIVDDANREAEEIIQDANARAQQIIDDANSEAESIRESAREQGYAEGHESGYQEGLAATKEIERSLDERAAKMEEDYEEKISLLEPRFVETLTDIYSHVFNVDLSDKVDIVTHLLKDAIRNIESKSSLLIHVSKDDFPEVNAAKDNLTEGLASSVSIEIIEDITLPKAHCFIEADSGIFDCSLGTELELLKKELVLLSYQKEP